MTYEQYEALTEAQINAHYDTFYQWKNYDGTGLFPKATKQELQEAIDCIWWDGLFTNNEHERWSAAIQAL